MAKFLFAAVVFGFFACFFPLFWIFVPIAVVLGVMVGVRDSMQTIANGAQAARSAIERQREQHAAQPAHPVQYRRLGW